MTDEKDLETVKFNPGDVLFREGEQSFAFYIVNKGEVEIFMMDSECQKVSLAVVGDGQAVGEFAMFSQKPRSATAQALTEVVAIKVTEAGYKKLLDELPSWAYSVMESLIERLRHADDVIKKHNHENVQLQSQLQQILNK